MMFHQLTNQEEIFMFKKSLKAIVYFLGLSGSADLAHAISSPDEIPKTNQTIYCPDYIICTPKTGDGKRDCEPNTIPFGLSKDGMSVEQPYVQSTYKFVTATQWTPGDQQPVCTFHYTNKDRNETMFIVMSKNPGATFFADTSKPNLWKKVNDRLTMCDATTPTVCPFF